MNNWKGLALFFILSGFSMLKVSAQSKPFNLLHDNLHDLELKQADGAYVILTSGSDPYLFTQPVEQGLQPDETILTFEYFSPDYLDNFQVFFGPPISENKSISSELGIREGWTTHTIDVSDEIKDWGAKGSIMRFDFGGAPNYHIQIRNIHFRKPTSEELQKKAARERVKQAEALIKTKLEEYLSHHFVCSISQVTVNKEKILIKGNGNLADMYIAEVQLQDDIQLMQQFSSLTTVNSKNDFTITLNRYIERNGIKYDRLLSKWAIVQKKVNGYTLQSQARYADYIEPLYNLPEETLRGKKGIGGFSATGRAPVSDIDSLGITSVTVNMWITKMMRSKPGADNISFNYNGKTYYANKRWVENMDKTLQLTAQKNIIVSSIILIDKAVNCDDKEIGRIFQHPDCDPAGIYSMANMTTAEGVEYYAAAIDFLAQRYSRPDKKYGRIHNWIVHNEVDAGWVWTNMGEKDKLLFMDTYHKSMRLIHNIARKYNPYAKAFITLTHFWAWTVDKHFYHSVDLLNILLDYSAKEGDFEWGIAHHPYPESLFEPKSWLDQKCEFNFNTPLITFKNIEVLNTWVKQPYTRFLGKIRRTVFLSEQGPNSKDYTDKSLTEQAASMAYVWKKIKNLDAIDAFQFHNWVDDRGEGGLRIGLRRFLDDKDDPGGKKPVWYVFRDIETAREESSCEFAKPVIGINHWDEVLYSKQITEK
ncbi:MAG: hypothetical protein KF862_24060 [Chitinophagaceae bacterium]|nr:hypothetical protein [Chitinophagaceae bacterium]